MSSSKVTTKEIIETTERYPVQHEEYVRTFGGVKTMSIPFTARTKKVLVKHHYFRESYEEEQCKQLEDHHTTYTPFSPKTRNHKRNNYVDTLSSSTEQHSLRSQRNNLISSYILKSSTPERSYNVVTARTNVNRSKQKYNNNKYHIINPFKKNERYVEEYYPSQRAVTLSSEYHHSCHHNKQNETVYIYSSEIEGTPERIETNPEYVAENIHILTNNNYDDDAYKRDCIVFIQSCYRGHLTRKSLYDNLRYFYRIHSASEIIKGVFDKHNQRLFYRKANKYVVYLNSVYLKKIVRIDVNNLPQYYKRNVRYTLLRKDKGEAFQVLRKRNGTSVNNVNSGNSYYSEIHNIVYNVTTDEQQHDKLYKMKLQNKLLKQLLIMKLQKEENNLRERFLKFKGTDKERYDALLKRNKEQQLRNLLKKKINKKENELKHNFAKFFYLGVMREMTMTQEEREALQTQKKLKHIVNNKTLKENNTNISKAFKQFYLNGLVKELKKAVDKAKEQQEHINQQSKTIEELRNSIQQQVNEKETAPTQLMPQEELDKIKQRKVKKLINNKIKDDKKFLHDQFVKLYYNGLYKYMVHDKPKEDMLKLQQLQQELNEVKEQQQQQQQQTAAMPQQQQQLPQYDKLVPKKSLEIEIPADNTNTNVLSPQQQQQNEGTTSSKNKAKELRKLIRNRAKMNREKLRKYFDKLYTNGIIRSLKNAPKTLSQTNTPVNKEQIVYISSSSQPQQQKTAQQQEEERIENEKAQKAKEREDMIRKHLDKIVYQIDRNNLLVSKSVFSKWNLRTKLLRLKEVKGKKKKKKSVSPTNKSSSNNKSTALPKVNAVKLRTLTPLAKNTPMIVEEEEDNNDNEIVIGQFEVNEEANAVSKPLRSRARAPRVDNDNDNEEGVNTNDIEHLKYLLEEYEEEEEDDDEDEDVYEGENEIEIEMPVINEAPELQGVNNIEIPQQQITNKSVTIKKVLTSPITSTNNVTTITTPSGTTSANIQKPTRSKAPIKLRANKKQSATIKPVTEDTQIQTDPFEFISNLMTKNVSNNVHKLPQSIQSLSLSYIAANTTNEGNVQLPKDVEELEKKELIALFTFGFLCSFFLLFQQG